MNIGITVIMATLVVASMGAHASPANEAAAARTSAAKEKPAATVVGSARLPTDKSGRRESDKTLKESPAKPVVTAEPLNGFSPLYIDP